MGQFSDLIDCHPVISQILSPYLYPRQCIYSKINIGFVGQENNWFIVEKHIIDATHAYEPIINCEQETRTYTFVNIWLCEGSLLDRLPRQKAQNTNQIVHRSAKRSRNFILFSPALGWIYQSMCEILVSWQLNKFNHSTNPTFRQFDSLRGYKYIDYTKQPLLTQAVPRYGARKIYFI